MLSLPIAQRPEANRRKASLPRIGLLVLLASLIAAPAWSQDDEEDDEPSAFSGYMDDVVNRLLMGVNSITTFPADPVMATVAPREEFEELPVAPVSSRFVGLFQGTLLGAYRAGAGVFDIAFSPITPMRMLSPEPRYQLFEGVEHEWY